MWWCAVILLGAVVLSSGKDPLKVIHQWRSLDFDYPTSYARKEAIQKGEFKPGAAVPIDIDYWQSEGKSKMFMTIPQFFDGIPASLVTVNNRNHGESPLLSPYPDWSWHRRGNCDGLTSVFRTQVDQCERLWVIDSGMVDLFKVPRRRLCQPQVVAFDLYDDQMVGKHVFPDNLLTAGSVLTTIAVDVRDAHGKCKDTFAYVADVTGFAILVLDAKRGKSWRVQSNSMYPYPPQGFFQANGEEFDLMDGIIGLAVAPLKRNDRELYYHSFASLRESHVATSVLRNESLYSTGFNMAPRLFHTTEEIRPSQTAPEVFDKNGNLYFAPVAQNAIYCWNSEHSLNSRNLRQLHKDDKNLQFVTGIKISENANGEEDLYVFTTRFQLAMVGKMNQQETNFRVLKGRISDLTHGTDCHKGTPGPRPDRPIIFPKPRPSSSGGSGYGYFTG